MGPQGMTGPHWNWLLVAVGFRVSFRTQLLMSGFHRYLRTTLVGSEAGAVATAVGTLEEASSLEDRWMGVGLRLLLPQSHPGLRAWKRGIRAGSAVDLVARREEGRNWLMGEGNHAVWLHSLIPSSASPFSGGWGGTEGTLEEAEQEKDHTLCPQCTWLV